MNKPSFYKVLSATDAGVTKSNQAGLHIPITDRELLDFLSPLDTSILNPSAWITCIDEHGQIWKFRFVYYNNKIHSVGGTRNEYRLTHTTRYFRKYSAFEGDSFEISKDIDTSLFRIRLLPAQKYNRADKVKLRGWNRRY
jgi:hypothetical protein